MELVPVKKSTLATWCRDVALTEEQIEAISARSAPLPGYSRDTNRKRLREIEKIKAKAIGRAEELILEPLWLAGAVLYWAEGFKTQRQLGMSNSDPYVLRLFMRWADTYLGPPTGFRAKINLHADNDEPAARRWWSSQLGLPLEAFNKTFIKPDGTGHRKNHLSHGVCMVAKRKSADAFHATKAWIAFLQEQLGQ